MKAHIEDYFQEAAWAVWLHSDDGRGVYRVGRRTVPAGGEAESRLVLCDVPEGVRAEPTLLLPYAAMDAILAALPGRARAGDATTEALHDARAVRDRLLGLFEAQSEDLSYALRAAL